MKHSSTRELFDYWNMRRGSRSAPERSEIEPGAIRHILADTFMLTFDPRAGHPFRIAGTRVCAAFGRELKGVGFTEIWARASKDPIRDVLTTVASESVGVVAGASGRSHSGAALELEFLVLPLAHRGGASTRILGALVPTEVPYWLGVETPGPTPDDPLSGDATGSYSAPRGAPAVPSHARAPRAVVMTAPGLSAVAGLDYFFVEDQRARWFGAKNAITPEFRAPHRSVGSRIDLRRMRFRCGCTNPSLTKRA